AADRKQDHPLALLRRQQIDNHVDADMDAGSHAVSGAELRHPDEHEDAEFLRPGNIELGKKGVDLTQDYRHDRDAVRFRPFCTVDGEPSTVAMNDGKEDERRRSGNERRNQPLLEMIEDAQEQAPRPSERFSPLLHRATLGGYPSGGPRKCRWPRLHWRGPISSSSH